MSVSIPIEVGTVNEIYARLINEGYRISNTCLRAWVKSGTVPAVYSGTRAYISYTNVLKVLQGGNDNTPPPNSGIRRIA